MRRKNDNYPTPAHQVHALVTPLVDLLGDSLRGTVIEPCAGDGNIAKVIEESTKCYVVQKDLLTGFDATDKEFWEKLKYKVCRDFWLEDYSDNPGVTSRINWTITNPPFNLALPIIKNAWEFSGTGIAFLLPITWNEPCSDRRDWLIDHADNLRCIMPVSPRPHFRNGEINPKTGKEYKEDPRTVAWYVWRKDWSWAEMGLQSPFQYLAGWR